MFIIEGVNNDNGNQEMGSERLDRIERALDLILDDHIKFREEQKFLLSAQVVMHGSMEELRDGLADLRGDVDKLRGGIDELRGGIDELRGDLAELRVDVQSVSRDVAALTRNVEAMRSHFDERLTRLEGR